jgi:hypothetical protein
MSSEALTFRLKVALSPWLLRLVYSWLLSRSNGIRSGQLALLQLVPQGFIKLFGSMTDGCLPGLDILNW